MDPQACFARIVAAFADEDYDEAYAACADLLQWFRRGGFGPTLICGHKFGPKLVESALVCARLHRMPPSCFLPQPDPNYQGEEDAGDFTPPSDKLSGVEKIEVDLADTSHAPRKDPQDYPDPPEREER